MAAVTAIDRLAMRARPEGSPIMEQDWGDVLFLHWPISESVLRPLVPKTLEIDLFEGRAWVGITPFRVTNLRLLSLPPIPGMDAFNEVNVRTYVHCRGTPGIWFLSLDASKIVPAIAARLFYQVPYYTADIEYNQSGSEFSFDTKRTLEPAAQMRARWRRGSRLRDPDAESLAFFLVERYCFFTESAGELSVTRAYHHPWILDDAQLELYDSSLLTAAGLPQPAAEPLLHFSTGVNAQLWPPEPI